jgi:acetyltransferase-like isoleucine patch superfamily enzyme
MKKSVKVMIELAAGVIIWPRWMMFKIYRRTMGEDRACAAIGQRASRWAGIQGEYFRRKLYGRIIQKMGSDVVISFGTVLTKATIELGDRVYIGSYCLLGDVRVDRDTLIADHVNIPSGGKQHGISRLDVPMREQAGEARTIRVGEDCWIGSGSVVMADVGNHCVVGAGSVVTRPVEDYKIVAGNPARVIGDRREKAGEMWV